MLRGAATVLVGGLVLAAVVLVLAVGAVILGG